MNEYKKDFLIGIFIFVLNIIFLYYLWQNNSVLTLSLLVISIFILLFWTSKEEKILYLIGFVLVPIYDLILVPTGIWSYGNPTIFRVPLWLPLLYGILTVTAIKIGRNLAKIFK